VLLQNPALIKFPVLNQPDGKEVRPIGVAPIDIAVAGVHAARPSVTTSVRGTRPKVAVAAQVVEVAVAGAVAGACHFKPVT